ncbi:MAG: acetyl/propionyl-CoA carboxylase subunit alpha, partial [Planctomycetes bacterium]|nr:acetyl/propionyl-CoA carboxylase subunit alpha [Planctomycetota bacterium]
KIIEEAPSPIVDTELRVQMSEAAVRLAKQVGYQNAGTVEFLVDARGSFYFLEMNTRLQVEHPVTECTTGLDLVQLQVLVAGGAKLPDLLRGRDLTPRGHAIEVRVYAEDPAQGYLPAAGVIQRVVEPCGPGVRVDSGVVSGTEIGVQFDPMISKIIVHGMDRENARQRLLAALRETAYLGISTNLDFLCRVLEQPGFIAGELSTGFLDANPELARASEPAPDLAYLAAALCGSLTPSVGRKPVAAGDAGPGTLPDVWDEGSGLRLWGQA